MLIDRDRCVESSWRVQIAMLVFAKIAIIQRSIQILAKVSVIAQIAVDYAYIGASGQEMTGIVNIAVEQ